MGFHAPHYGFKFARFSLDQPGDFFELVRNVDSYGGGFDSFRLGGIASAAVGGYRVAFYQGTVRFYSTYASKLLFGQRISAGQFTQIISNLGAIVVGDRYGLGGQGLQWRSPGAGFIGFRFNNGAGVQYGWVRIKIDRSGGILVPFELFDYAYADPGEPITAGQMSSDEQAPVEQAPDQGSLGWLALGAVGLLAWRKNRSRTGDYTGPPSPV